MASHTGHQGNSPTAQHLDDCIRLCLECACRCEQCGAECVHMDMRGMTRCIELCRDCAGICWLDAQFMSRHSPFHVETCRVCAEVCEACATECERMAAAHEGDMQTVFRQCADICRRTAESCRAMAAMAPAS